jgi:hypothetical protein
MEAKSVNRREATRKYYQKNKDRIIERNRQWLANDPTGDKMWNMKASKARYNYRINPSERRAMTLYAALNKLEKKDITITATEAKQLMDEYMLDYDFRKLSM